MSYTVQFSYNHAVPICMLTQENMPCYSAPPKTKLVYMLGGSDVQPHQSVILHMIPISKKYNRE